MLGSSLSAVQTLGQGLSPSVPGPSTRPVDGIRLKLLGVRLKREQTEGELSVYTQLPMLMQAIEQEHEREAKAKETIERAKLRLAAPPPDAPTVPNPNLGETIGGSLASLFSGGGLGASRAANATTQVAMQRQGREFENAIRRFQVDHEDASRDLALGREDQLQAQGRQNHLGREKRETAADEHRNLVSMGLQRLNAEERSLDTELAFAMKRELQADEERRARDRAKYDLELDKEKATFDLGIQKQLDDYRRKGDDESKRGAVQVAELWDIGSESHDRAAVAGALDGLARVQIPIDGKLRTGLINDAGERAAGQDRGQAIGTHDPSMPLVKTYLPLQGDIRPTESDLVLRRPAVRQGLPLGPAFNSKVNLDRIRGGHRALLGQNPFPGVTSQRDAEARLNDVQRQEWGKWNGSVRRSAEALAAARKGFVERLPLAERKAAAASAHVVLDQIKRLAGRAQDPGEGARYVKLQRELRVAFEERYGIDVDTAVKVGGR